MAVFFATDLAATPDRITLPADLSLTCTLRSTGDDESAVLQYRLDQNSDVWFDTGDGVRKSIRTSGSASPTGTGTRVDARLVQGPGQHFLTTIIRAEVRSSDSAQGADRESVEILLG